MTRLTTWARAKNDDLVAIRDLQSIGNSVVTGLRYFVPRAMPTEVWHFDGFDVVPGGVLLIARPQPIFVTWHMDDLYGDGIALVRGDDYFDWVSDLDLVQVPTSQASAELEGILSRELSLVAVAWQEAPPEDQPSDWRTVWALTLGVAGASVTFALGSSDGSGGRLAYQPDSIAVIFDLGLARHYQPVAAATAAFGQTIWQAEPDEPSM